MGERVVEAVDLGVNVRRLGAVDDLAGREDARREDLARALHLGRDEDLGGARRRIVDRRRAQARLTIDDQFCCGTRSSSPCGPWAWASTRPGMIVLPVTSTSSRRRESRPRRAGRPRDAVAADDDHPVVDDSAVGRRHGDDPGAGEGDGAGRLVGGDVHRQRHAGRRRLELGGVFGRPGHCRTRRGVGRVDGRARCSSAAGGRSDQWMKSAPSRADPGDRQRPALGVGGDVLGARHERHHEGLVILAEGDILAVGRDLIVADHLAGRMDALRLAVEVGADQLALVVGGDDHEHAVVRRAELGLGAVAGDPRRRAAGAATR
jgi:hypothetical protein